DLLRTRLEKRVGIRDEFHHAAAAAKVIRFFSVFLFPWRARWIHGHTADRIDCRFALYRSLATTGGKPARLFSELRYAVWTAKVIGAANMFLAPGCAFRIALHSAYWVGGSYSIFRA